MTAPVQPPLSRLPMLPTPLHILLAWIPVKPGLPSRAQGAERTAQPPGTWNMDRVWGLRFRVGFKDSGLVF